MGGTPKSSFFDDGPSLHMYFFGRAGMILIHENVQSTSIVCCHGSGDGAASLAGNVGDMSATRQNVAYFCPDKPILAT